MKINRDNYESYFIRLLDGELDAAEQKAVMDFLEAHADLRGSWEALQRTQLQADPAVVFPDKQLLYRAEAALEPAETDFILYHDQELSPQEKIRVDNLLKAHPSLQPLFDRLMQLRFQPDPAIRFEPKSLLYRSEKKRVSLPYKWQRWAAAALLIITAGLSALIYRNMATENTGSSLAKTPSPRPALINASTPEQAAEPSVVAGISSKRPIAQSSTPSKNAVAKSAPDPKIESAPALTVSERSPDISETTPVIGAGSLTPIPPNAVVAESSLPATETEPVNTGSQQNSVDPQSATAAPDLIQWTHYIPTENTLLEKKIDRKVRLRTALRQVNRILEKATEKPGKDPEGRHLHIAFLNIALEND